MLVKMGGEDAIINIDFKNKLAEQAENYNLAQIRSVIGHLQTVGEQLRQNANPQLALEELMLNIPKRRMRGEANITTQLRYG